MKGEVAFLDGWVAIKAEGAAFHGAPFATEVAGVESDAEAGEGFVGIGWTHFSTSAPIAGIDRWGGSRRVRRKDGIIKIIFVGKGGVGLSRSRPNLEGMVVGRNFDKTFGCAIGSKAAIERGAPLLGSELAGPRLETAPIGSGRGIVRGAGMDAAGEEHDDQDQECFADDAHDDPQLAGQGTRMARKITNFSQS